MQHLKKYFSYFNTLKDSTWQKIEPLFTPLEIKKGDYLIRSGEVGQKIAFLKSGIVRVYYTNKKGIEYNKHFFVENNLIGSYTSLITGKPTVLNQQALTDCTLLIADYKDFRKLYDTCPDLERVARILAEYLYIEKENREIEIVMLEASERYANFQLQFPLLEQQIAQYHIASYLGISATQLSRIRKKNSLK